MLLVYRKLRVTDDVDEQDMCDLKLDLLFDFSGHLAISRIVRKPLSHIKRGELRPFGLNAAPLQLGVGRSSFALATARQMSACRAEAFGVGGLGVCHMNLDHEHEHGPD